nr:leucine-rich repeat-containing protein 74A-like [Biomphalaria glabrata]
MATQDHVLLTQFEDEDFNSHLKGSNSRASYSHGSDSVYDFQTAKWQSASLHLHRKTSDDIDNNLGEFGISSALDSNGILDVSNSEQTSDSGDLDLDNYVELNDSDYDTDLEMDDDKYVYPEKYDHDITGHRRYIQACQEFGVQPIRYFLEHMQDDSLSLKYQGLGPDAMKALAAPLEINTTIEFLDLEGNWIMGEGACYLCRVLKENVFVSHLNLSDNRLGYNGAAAVCQLLMVNKTIEKLNLSGNNIGDQAGELFHSVLTKSNSTLRSLNLSHNRLEEGAALWLKNALIENETLEHLDISWNHFQSKGCVLIAQGLKENVGLKELAVAMNGFGAEGGKTLGDALKVNRTLQKLDASYCRLPTECIGSIAHGLMHNDHLKIIDLSYNCFRAEETLELLKGIEKNEASQLSLLHLGNTQVEAKFKDLQDKLRKERRLEVIHGGILDDYRMEITEMDPMEIFRRDPFTKLKEWVAKAGYRLIDLLRHFDKDQSMTISTEEFRRGIASTAISITEEQLQILIDRLDNDGDGEIDFSELVEGDRQHRKAKRDVLAEMERRASQGK